ncbi:hypothetical protein F0562_004098 [Nyssa sinensis]|uniref:Uncharacterized protein n=1 Tax=Nyssa sinensis TaxID=561372 RepID=A0A5J5BXM0_9ASTE|nr:hypothetical protein F0562_004098 [Nyssa sinensis]
MTGHRRCDLSFTPAQIVSETIVLLPFHDNRRSVSILFISVTLTCVRLDLRLTVPLIIIFVLHNRLKYSLCC